MDVCQQEWGEEFSRQIEGWGAACWAETGELRKLLWEAGVTLRAGDVRWTAAQATVVGEAVQRIADRFDGKARPLVGGVTLILQSQASPWWAPLWRWWNRKPAGYRFGAYQNRGKICVTPSYVNVGGLVHELGHYYDEKQRLSRAYQAHVKQAGLELETNRFEDFANAFAAYVLDRPLAAARRGYLEQLRIQQPGIG
jgi:hypothetical protein